MSHRIAAVMIALLVLLVPATFARAAEPIPFEQETLANGLRVIYAPLPTSPVVHVRVLYHVGSKDERPDRQGFAHMFEHMMFRGSAHVAPEEHMKTIGMVGGYSNAFTSFDQTVYINTVPAPYMETALYLEADRMASFKVSPEIYETERKVVAQEWALRHNQPYGTVYEELFRRVFTKHSYNWTPIGNMDHLRAASAPELQEFFNNYYVPNNAVLVVAGKFDTPATKALVKKYYEWIPGETKTVGVGLGRDDEGRTMDAHRMTRPAPVQRNIPAEPEQTEPRRAEMAMKVPLARVIVCYPMPPYKSSDQDALGILATILGDGRSSRLSRLLVTSENPLCTNAGAVASSLEDGGLIGASATVLDGKSPADVEKVIRDAIADVIEKGVTAEELAKAKQQARLSLAGRRETAERIASELGEAALFRGDPSYVNTEEERLARLTAADVQAAAKKYFRNERSTTLIVKPDPNAPLTTAPAAASAPASAPAGDVAPKAITFPADYPPRAPLPSTAMKATFEKGVEKEISGVKVIVMPDRRLPLVSWSLTMRSGSHAEPAEKDGLGSITASMVRRGPRGTTFNEFNEELESRAISLEVSDGGDTTRVGGSCLTEHVPFAFHQMRRMLLEPAFAADEFAKLKAQNLSSLRMALNSPTNVAGEELGKLIYGDSPLGRATTIESVSAITLDDVKDFYGRIYRSNGAILMISGDVSVEEGQKLAEKLLAVWQPGELPKVSYDLPPVPAKRTILLIDRPESKQANLRVGIRAYSIRSDEKYAGSLASQILSAGIDSRLGRYVRAEKGFAYGVHMVYSPNRQDGAFTGGTDTKIENAADAIEAVFKVLTTMRQEPVTEKELTDAKLRVAGGMVMQMQTISQQANRRVEGILNDYPIDYYDRYAERISQVSAAEIRDVMKKYSDDSKMAIVVVAPAEATKEQLSRLGEVRVVPMPLQRGKATQEK